MDRRGLLKSTAAVGAAGATAWGAGSVGSAAARQRRDEGRGPGPLRVHIVVFDGVEELDFAGPLEVFGAARSVGQPACAISWARSAASAFREART